MIIVYLARATCILSTRCEGTTCFALLRSCVIHIALHMNRDKAYVEQNKAMQYSHGTTCATTMTTVGTLIKDHWTCINPPSLCDSFNFLLITLFIIHRSSHGRFKPWSSYTMRKSNPFIVIVNKQSICEIPTRGTTVVHVDILRLWERWKFEPELWWPVAARTHKI